MPETPVFCSTEHLLTLFGRSGCRPAFLTLGHEQCRAMLARVLIRVPYKTLLHDVTGRCFFVMAGARCADYLSAKLLEGRSLIVLGEELLDLPEEKQVEIVLPLVARVVLKAKHGYEETAEMDQFWQHMDQPGACPVELNQEFTSALDSEVNLQIDAHDDRQKAEALAQTWVQAWQEAPPGDGTGWKPRPPWKTQ
jgi:hypothetical protein